MTIKYTGKHGEFIHGIPTRDLTDDEWNELTEAQRKFATDSGLYTEGKATKAAKVEAKPEETKAAGG